MRGDAGICTPLPVTVAAPFTKHPSTAFCTVPWPPTARAGLEAVRLSSERSLAALDSLTRNPRAVGLPPYLSYAGLHCVWIWQSLCMTLTARCGTWVARIMVDHLIGILLAGDLQYRYSIHTKVQCRMRNSRESDEPRRTLPPSPLFLWIEPDQCRCEPAHRTQRCRCAIEAD